MAGLRRKAFTLVEILIVVIILGILAAIVVPQVARATEDSATTTTYSELQKIRRHIEVYRARNGDALPTVVEGVGTWGEIVGNASEYLGSPPVNAWVGNAAGRSIVFGNIPDVAYHQNYGWIYDPVSGWVWAASFDDNDEPLPRP